MNVRKMLEDLAKITEARGIQPGSPKVDVIVWVAQDVPQSVYLDETYAFRVLMNVRVLEQHAATDPLTGKYSCCRTPKSSANKVTSAFPSP